MSNDNKKDIHSSDKVGGRITVKRPTVRVGASRREEKPAQEKNEQIRTAPQSINEKPEAKKEEPVKKTAEESGQAVHKGKESENGKKTFSGNLGAKLKDGKLSGFLKDNTKNVSAGRMLECGSVDIPLLMIFIMLAVFGLVMVFSASYAYAYSKEDNSYVFIKNQTTSYILYK